MSAMRQAVASDARHALLLRPVRDRTPEGLASLWREVERACPEWQRDGRDWQGSRLAGASPLAAGIPWINYPALEWLKARKLRGARVLEWGSGGSTLFFARRAKRLISVEHDALWHARVLEAVAQLPSPGPLSRILGRSGCRPRLEIIPPEMATGFVPERYGSGRPDLAGLSFERYVRRIEALPERSLDLVLVDGRARPGCLEAALPKLAGGGAILLDNSDYARYATALAALRQGPLRDWHELELMGPGPASAVVGWCTTIWQRPR
jgi:hypothetical protein